MKKFQHDGKEIKTGAVQFGQHPPGLFLSAGHSLEMSKKLEELKAAFNDDPLNVPLQIAIIELLNWWDDVMEVTGDADLRRIVSTYVSRNHSCTFAEGECGQEIPCLDDLLTFASDGQHAFVCAAEKGDVYGLEVVLKYGVEVNCHEGPEGVTALILAARHGYLTAVEFLISHGANVDEEAYLTGETPLMATSDVNIAEFLLLKGAAVNKVDYEGRTALMQAAMHGLLDIVPVLLKYGAEVHRLDEAGYTALAHAKLSGHKDIEEVLVKAGDDQDSVQDLGPSVF